MSLPLNRTQAKKLIQCCRQAPYGQGSDTIVDTDVRRVWELDPQQFQLTGPEWDSMVTAIVEGAQAALGLNDVKLNTELYKMLLYEKASSFLPHRYGEKLEGMIATLPDKNADRIAVGQLLSNRLVARLEAVDQGSTKSANRPWMRPPVDRSKLLTSLVKGLVSLSADEALQKLIDHTLGSEQYDLTDCHVAAIGGLESWLARNLISSDASLCNAAIESWLQGCRSRLEDMTSSAPEAPGDFRRADTVTCTCRDCAALKAFLVNPTEQVGRFPLAKQRRQHLHQIIQRHNCDMTHTTDRRGSPQTLVCTKTTASYDAAFKVFKRDSANLKKIITLAEKLK